MIVESELPARRQLDVDEARLLELLFYLNNYSLAFEQVRLEEEPHVVKFFENTIESLKYEIANFLPQN